MPPKLEPMNNKCTILVRETGNPIDNISVGECGHILPCPIHSHQEKQEAKYCPDCVAYLAGKPYDQNHTCDDLVRLINLNKKEPRLTE